MLVRRGVRIEPAPRRDHRARVVERVDGNALIVRRSKNWDDGRADSPSLRREQATDRSAWMVCTYSTRRGSGGYGRIQNVERLICFLTRKRHRHRATGDYVLAGPDALVGSAGLTIEPRAAPRARRHPWPMPWSARATGVSDESAATRDVQMDQGATRRFPWRHGLPDAGIVDAGTSAKTEAEDMEYLVTTTADVPGGASSAAPVRP
jgi:hypothetical protein